MGLNRIARIVALVAAAALATGALAGCRSCSSRAGRFLIEQTTEQLAEKVNDHLAGLPFTGPGETTPFDVDDPSKQLRVTKGLPAGWPDDVVRPFHAVLLKAAEEVAPDGGTGASMYALYESTDEIDEVENYYRRAVGSVARRPDEPHMRVLPLMDPERQNTVICLSNGPKGRTRIGIEVTRMQPPEIADAGESVPVAPLKPVHTTARFESKEYEGVDVAIGHTGVITGAVSDDETTLATRRTRMMQCYAGDAPKHAPPPATLDYRIKVRATGEVDRATLVSNRGMPVSGATCVTRVIEGTKFSKVTPGGAAFDVKLDFAPLR